MTLKLTQEALHEAMPRAPKEIIEVFVRKQAVLDKSGITENVKRLAAFFANLAHETNQFRIQNLTENIHYTAQRMADVWENRFHGKAYLVVDKYGDSPGWQKKAFDDIYGNRMGNHPGTHDGSNFIGRGGPQWTGRDGYEELERRTGLPATTNPDSICEFEVQPEVSAAYWDWKEMNELSDRSTFRAICIRWNGGLNGYSSRVSYYEKMLQAFKGLGEGKGAPIKEVKQPTVAQKPAAQFPTGSLLELVANLIKSIIGLFTKGK